MRYAALIVCLIGCAPTVGSIRLAAAKHYQWCTEPQGMHRVSQAEHRACAYEAAEYCTENGLDSRCWEADVAIRGGRP